MTSASESVLTRAAAVRLAVFDVDGVMTDGRLYLGGGGLELKAFHTHDGLGLKALMQHGIAVAVLTARRSELVAERMRELGIERLVQGCRDKGAAISELASGLSLELDAVAYTGDDLIDWPAMRGCGLKCAPADANDWIRHQVDFVTQRDGGRGAVREVCELILDAGGHLKRWQDSFR